MAVRRGQVLSIDAAVALTVLVLFVVGVMAEGQAVEAAAVRNADFTAMEEVAVAASDTLVLTRGQPPYWYVAGVPTDSLGLAWRDHVLDDEKLQGLNDTAPDRVEQLLGAEEYGMYVRLVNATTGTFSGCRIDGDRIVAGNPPVDAAAELRIDRLVHTEDGRRCALRVVVWR